MFEHLMNATQKALREEVRDLVRWVPRDLILALDRDEVRFPTDFLAEAGPDKARALKARVAAEIKTTFASHYTAVVALEEVLSPAAISAYGKRATGQKYLIDPTL